MSKNQSVSQNILNYTNQYRSEVNVNSLTLDNNLSLAANIRALEIAWSGKFSHYRPDSTYFYTVLNETGDTFLGAGENIASGHKSAQIVSEAWKNSEGHYKNMVNEKFNKLGVGMVEVEGTKYWVQLFSD